MESILEKWLIYGAVALLLATIILLYIRRLKKESKIVDEKIRLAKEDGLFEPVSLHPVVDPNSCIQSGACIRACPEHDILGIRNGKATVINASRCVGHGACFHACPTQAISLHIGTEKRGVDLPHVNPYFETNVSGIYIAGEMGGMGLIKNAVEQGKQAVENIARNLDKKTDAEFDLVIIGAGPAGISATLQAKKLGLKCVTLEQDSLGGTVFTFPRAKIVMTAPMDLPLFGKIKLHETSKTELLNLWKKVIADNNLTIQEHRKVDKIIEENGAFTAITREGNKYVARAVLLAIGRRGTPRKLNIPGENLEKVAYRLLEPELISGKKAVVVGGGDSAVESALLLSGNNDVVLSYRGESFARLKPKNSEKLQKALLAGELSVLLQSNLTEIDNDFVTIKIEGDEKPLRLENQLVYVFAGGELPTEFLKNVGIEITRKFGDAILKHSKN